MTDSRPLISIIIVNFNTKDLLEQCLRSIYANSCNYLYEIIVVDNASRDDSLEMLKQQFPTVYAIDNKQNLGFSKANNFGIEKAKGKYVLLLNSDTIVLENTLNHLFEFLENNKNITAVGPKLLNYDKTIQRSWFDFPNPLKTFSNLTGLSFYIVKLKNSLFLKLFFSGRKKPAFMINAIPEAREMDYLTLACLLIRKDMLNKIGNLDEQIFFYHEDCELGYRFRASQMKTYYLPAATIIHLGGSSSQKNILMSFEQFYLNLLYVFKKYESKIKYFQLKMLLLIAFIIRAFFWSFGVYRRINMFGVYSANPQKNDIYRPKDIDVLKLYFKMINTLLFNKKRIPKN